MKLIVDPIWSWPVVALIAGATLALVIATYRQRLAHLPAGTRRFLTALRLLAWALLIFAILRPALEISETDKRSSIFAIITDRSRSMGIADGSAGMTRRQALLKTLADAKPELEALSKEVELQHFEFDKDLERVEERPPEAPGEQSAIGHSLDSFNRQVQGKRVAGVLLASDGAQRSLPPNDTDARTAARRLEESQIVVHTMGFGASGLTGSAQDLIVEDLEVSPTVFEKNTVVASAKIRALGAAGRELTVRLLIEDPAATQPGQPTRMRIAAPPLKLQTSLNEDVLPVELSFIAEQAGEFRLTMEVVPLDGEPLVVNNQQTTFLTVLKGGISIAYFDKLRPEQKFVRMVSESPDMRLDFKPIRQGGSIESTQINPEWFEPGQYDVYIIGDVPAKSFTPDVLRKLARSVELGAGLMMTGGFRSFGPGGYADTPLADLLPVRMDRTELQNPNAEIDEQLHYLQPLQMLPTSQGLQHFVMRLDAPGQNAQRWKSLAPLQGANKFRGLKPLGVVLAESQEKLPLLIAQEVGRSRTMAFAADTTYQWVLAGQLESHQRFWQQAILWLAHKDQQGDDSVWLKLDARRFRTGQPVGMTFGARDADKQPLHDAEFAVEVTGPDDFREKLTPQRSGTENLARLLATQKPGEYKVRVEAQQNGQAIGSGAQARFIIYEQDLELHNPAADFALLEEISRITGGRHVPPEQLATFLRELLTKGGLRLEITKVRRITLWDNWPLVLAFVLSLTAEWYLRKKRGLV